MFKTHFLSQSQLESLTSPVRLALVQRLEIDGQATARELAQRMARPVTALYHHLKQLVDAGLVCVVGQRRGPRRSQAVYALVADRLSSAKAVKTRRGREIYARAGARVADAGARAFSAAITRGDARFEGRDRNAAAKYFVLRADAKKIGEINRLLAELENVAARSCDTGIELQLALLLSPL